MIKDLLEGPFRIEDVAKAFDAMSQEELVRETQALGTQAQKALWEAAKGFQRMSFADLVPPGIPDDTQVIHQGRNTMPLFNVFQKRFARPNEAAGVLYGYNHQSMQWFSGPGAFTVTEVDGECVIDCTRPPPRAIPGWPAPSSNTRGAHALVYGGLRDTLRKVSSRVLIGEPAKKGKPLGSYFVLARLT